MNIKKLTILCQTFTDCNCSPTVANPGWLGRRTRIYWTFYLIFRPSQLRGFLQRCFLALLVGHQLSEEDMVQDCPKMNNPPKNSYLKFSGGLFHLIYLWKVASFPKWIQESLHDVDQNRCIFIYFSISLVQSHWRRTERIKLGVCFLLHTCLSATESWAGKKLVGCGGWSCFWDTLFPCSGLTKAANGCLCAEPCTRVSCSPFPQEPGQ